MRIEAGEVVVATAGAGAAVTRDPSGALHLYSARAAAAELAPDGPGGGWTVFTVMLGASAPRARADEPPRALRDWLAADSARGARLYKTAAGLRVLLTSAPLAAGSAEAERAFAALGVPARTRRLAAERGAWRVRLEPGEALVATLGAGEIHPALSDAVELHDAWIRERVDPAPGIG